MKKPTVFLSALLSVFAALGLAISAAKPVHARESDRVANPDCSPSAWSEVKTLAEECLDLRERGERCDSVAFYDEGRSASFEIDGDEYSAEIFDSPSADDGDLNDVLLERDDGCVYELRNVPAFGDLLRALASVETR